MILTTKEVFLRKEALSLVHGTKSERRYYLVQYLKFSVFAAKVKDTVPNFTVSVTRQVIFSPNVNSSQDSRVSQQAFITRYFYCINNEKNITNVHSLYLLVSINCQDFDIVLMHVYSRFQLKTISPLLIPRSLVKWCTHTLYIYIVLLYMYLLV